MLAVKKVLTISFFFKEKDILPRFLWMRVSFLDNEPNLEKKKKRKEKFRGIVLVMAREVESGSRKKDLPQGLVRRAAKRGCCVGAEEQCTLFIVIISR